MNNNDTAKNVHILVQESPTSATAKVVTPEGFNWLFTIRDETASGLVTKMSQFQAYALTHHWQPAEGQRPRPATVAGQRGEGPGPLHPPAAVPAPVSNGLGHPTNGSGPERFLCQSLACTIDQGKKYWKVSDAGGRWKFPIMVYPEVLQQYFDLNTLDPGTVYSLTQWEASYVSNDKGYPKKVLALHPPGEVEPQTPVTPPPHQVREATPQPVQRQAAPLLSTVATMLQHSDPPRYNALLAAQGSEDEIPF